jgi:hypothetical protein
MIIGDVLLSQASFAVALNHSRHQTLSGNRCLEWFRSVINKRELPSTCEQLLFSHCQWQIFPGDSRGTFELTSARFRKISLNLDCTRKSPAARREVGFEFVFFGVSSAIKKSHVQMPGHGEGASLDKHMKKLDF